MARKKNLQHPIIAKILADNKSETLSKLEKGELAVMWENDLPNLYIGDKVGSEEITNLFEVFSTKFPKKFREYDSLYRSIINSCGILSKNVSLDELIGDPGIYRINLDDYKNCPIKDVGGYLIVLNYYSDEKNMMNSGTLQILVPSPPDNNKKGSIWYRSFMETNKWSDWFEVSTFIDVQKYVIATIQNTCDNGTIKNAYNLINTNSNKYQLIRPNYIINNNEPAHIEGDFFPAVYVPSGDTVYIQNISKTDFLSWLALNYYDSSISRVANTILAAPNGSNGAATFRKLVATDIPDLSDTEKSTNHTHKKVNGHSVESDVPANAKFTDTNTTYSTGTTTYSGTTKLYTGTGTNTDGTMTQAAIKSALDGKASSGHTHSYLPLTGGTISGNLSANNLLVDGKSGITNDKSKFNFLQSNSKYPVRDSNGDIVTNVYQYPSTTFFSDVGYRMGSSRDYRIVTDYLPCTGSIIYYASSFEKLSGNGGISRYSFDINLGLNDGPVGCLYYKDIKEVSDKYLKENIDNVNDKLVNVFDKADIISYTYKNNKEDIANAINNVHHRRHIGVFSQDMENILKAENISGNDCALIDSSFFLNATKSYLSVYGAANIKKFEKDGIKRNYSENTYNWKHRNDEENPTNYEVFNELIELNAGYLDYADYRKNIGYIMIEDISKLNKDQPPVYINNILITMKDGTEIFTNLSNEVIQYYENGNDERIPKNAGTSTFINDEDQLVIDFSNMNKQNGAVFIKLNNVINLDDINTILFDLDLISECKIRLIPEGDYTNANINDRYHNDQILYDYCFDYMEFHNIAAYVLQETRKEFKAYKEEKEKEITELKENYNSLLERIEALENK